MNGKWREVLKERVKFCGTKVGEGFCYSEKCWIGEKIRKTVHEKYEDRRIWVTDFLGLFPHPNPYSIRVGGGREKA